MLARIVILWLLGGVAAAPARRPAPKRTKATVKRSTPGKGSRRAVKPLLRRTPPAERQRRFRILGQLTNLDPQLRADAAWQAGRFRITAAYKRLRHMIRDRDPLVRRNAAYALGMLGNKEAAIVLVDRVPREQVPDVMVQLAIALGRLRHKSTRGFLVSLLFRRDPALRAAGITALGFLGEPVDVYTIGRFLRSNDAGERLSATTALGHLGSRLAIRPLQRLLADPSPAVQRATVESLAKLRARGSIPAMVKLLPTASPPVALALVRGLAQLDALKGLAALKQYLTATKDARLAAETAQAIGHLGGRLPVKRLLALLASRSNDVRIPAARAVGLGGIREAIPQLALLLAHPHPNLRLACAKALGRLAAHQAVATLLGRLRAEHGQVRAAYVQALGHIRAVTTLPLLARLLRSTDPRVVAAAAEAIGEISLLDRRPVKPLAKQLALLMTVRRSAQVAREGALAFARLRPRGQRKGFSRMLRLTLHRDPTVRARAVRSLGLYRDRLATPSILRLLGDDHLQVYSHAALAAGRLRLLKNYGTLQTLLTATSPETRPVAHARILLAVAMIDPSRRPEAARHINKILQRGPNTPAKAELVTSIAATRGRWVVPLLQRARQSSCYLVRAEAQRALSIWPPSVPKTAVKPTTPPKAPSTKPNQARAGARKKKGDTLAGPFPTPKPQNRGCGCAAGTTGGAESTGNGPTWLLLLAVLGLSIRRRRRIKP